jgi:hypothetical protein
MEMWNLMDVNSVSQYFMNFGWKNWGVYSNPSLFVFDELADI